jgi:hypothetical protein
MKTRSCSRHFQQCVSYIVTTRRIRGCKSHTDIANWSVKTRSCSRHFQQGVSYIVTTRLIWGCKSHTDIANWSVKTITLELWSEVDDFDNPATKSLYEIGKVNFLSYWVYDCYFNAKWEMSLLYHGENNLRFDEVMMIPALY